MELQVTDHLAGPGAPLRGWRQGKREKHAGRPVPVTWEVDSEGLTMSLNGASPTPMGSFGVRIAVKV